MKKLVRTNLTNSPTRRGTENLNIQFYSHDKNNAGFEFVVKNETDLSQYTAKVLFKFRDSNSTWEANGTIEGNVIKVTFNTNLIARCEEVLGYLFLDSDSDSLDVFKFKFNVVLSEIDKSEVANRQIKHVNNIGELELVTRSQLRDELSKLQINSVDLTNYLTTSVAETTYAKKTEIPTPYNDSVLVQKIGQLEARVDKDTVYDDTPLKERVTALESKAIAGGAYDNRRLERRVFNLEQGVMVNDAEVKSRLTTLEGKTDKFISGVSVNKEGSNVTLTYTYVDGQTKNVSFTDSDTVYDDSDIKARVETLEQRPTVDTSKFITEETLTAKKIVTRDELNTLKPNQILTINNNTLSITGGNSVELPVNRYEIHGTGMPNGVVEAEIGTTYIDKNKTNGAFKWIKTTDGGNQGWEVLTGDTGWRALNILSKLGSSFVKVRRVNNEVTYQFGGLSWGWFGIVRRGGVGYVTQTTDTERNCFIVGEHGIPAGFRTPNSLIGSIYNDRGIVYGTWYVGNGGDANHLRFQFLNPIPTDSDIGDIRVSQISYLTDDPWPVQLP